MDCFSGVFRMHNDQHKDVPYKSYNEYCDYNDKLDPPYEICLHCLPSLHPVICIHEVNSVQLPLQFIRFTLRYHAAPFSILDGTLYPSLLNDYKINNNVNNKILLLLWKGPIKELKALCHLSCPFISGRM